MATAALARHTAPVPRATARERAWRVIHACDSIRAVADLVEAQIAAGMRPFVLTGEAAARRRTLLETWQEVRTWRRHLDETDATSHPLHSSVVHAHSFSAAMAAMRAGLCTVYDADAFVEDYAVSSGQCTERSWLARSFRTAEEFVLSRVGAVVVHSSLMQRACRARGVGSEELFVIPHPMTLPPEPDTGWLRRAFDFPDEVVTVFARPNAAEDETLIRAFAQAAAEVPGLRLFLAVEGQSATLRRFVHQQEVDELVFLLSPDDEAPALRAADIVVAGWPLYPDATSWGRMHARELARSGTALSAMAHGRCLLAADCSAHRDLTPEGRGCLWYGSDAASSDKARELAHRISFLARNPDMRGALGATARQFLQQTRDPAAIGKRYAEVYRHAEQRTRRGDDATTQTPLMIPAEDCA